MKLLTAVTVKSCVLDVWTPPQCEKAQSFMDEIGDTRTLDFSALEYISSAGLGILLKTQKRLAASGAALKIVNVNKHIYDVFRYSGFNAIFDIKEKQ